MANMTKTKKLNLKPKKRKKKEHYNGIYHIEREKKKFVFC